MAVVARRRDDATASRIWSTHAVLIKLFFPLFNSKNTFPIITCMTNNLSTCKKSVLTCFIEAAFNVWFYTLLKLHFRVSLCLALYVRPLWVSTQVLGKLNLLLSLLLLSFLTVAYLHTATTGYSRGAVMVVAKSGSMVGIFFLTSQHKLQIYDRTRYLVSGIKDRRIISTTLPDKNVRIGGSYKTQT